MKFFFNVTFCIGLIAILYNAYAQETELPAVSDQVQSTGDTTLPQISSGQSPEIVTSPATGSQTAETQTGTVSESKISLVPSPEFSNMTVETSNTTDTADSSKQESSNVTIVTDSGMISNSSIPGAMLNASTKVVDKLSDQIRIILKHFQNPSEVSLPGDVIIPDPMTVPDMSGSLGIADGTFTNITVQEQSKFTIDTVNTNLDEMQIYVSLRMKRLVILGNYTMTALLFGSSEGPFNVTLTDVLAEGTVYLARDSGGRIFANKSVTNMVQQGITSHFVNSSSVYQGVINLAATFLFIGIKPYVLAKVDEKICTDINERLEHIAFRLPQTPWSPVDLAVLEGRKYVKKMGYDPYILKNVFKYDQDFLTVSVDKFTVHGLSKFYRVGNVTLLMENNNIQFGIRLMTSKLEGNLEWYYDFGKIGMTRNGTSKFMINRIQVEAIVNQSVDIRNKPILDSLDIETGPISVKMDGEGSFDYIVEFVILLLPKMIRLMVIDSLEIPIKFKVQEILDNVNVEKLVDSNLDDIDYYIQHFKLDY